jgi:hypothetical protein
VKIRSLLTVVAMLSVLLFGIGTAHAILGVQDDVPGRDLVWPIMCVKTPVATNNLNTNWAIADVIGGTPDANGILVQANCQLFTQTSTGGIDFTYTWTPFDVVVDNCASLVGSLTASQQISLETTIGGVVYHAGYVKCTQADQSIHPMPPACPTCTTNVKNRFMNNEYIVDTPLGFASGFNPPSIENGVTLYDGENGAAPQEVTALNTFFRYYIDNTDANTWNWWIILAGRNQYGIPIAINTTSTRILDCLNFCDEDEHCQSVPINIPNELNIIDVNEHYPGLNLHTSYPRAGFAACGIKESGVRNIVGFNGGFKLTGTINNPTLSPSPNGYYSLYGWSYQRVVASAGLIGDFDVVHPMFRQYCTGSTVATTAPGAYAVDNQGTCSCGVNQSGDSSGC